jgi:hypothetical protein
MTKKTKKLVYVKWIDAQSDPNWSEEHNIKEWLKEECLIHEVGWVMSEDSKYLILSSQLSYDGGIGNKTKIPKKWIKSIKKIHTDRV